MYYLKLSCLLMLSLLFISCGSGDTDDEERAAAGPGSSMVASRNISDMEDAKDMLFTAYAGIAYGNTDSIEDNNIFYNIMFYNLNNMVADQGFKAIPPDELSFASIYQMAVEVASMGFTRTHKEMGISEELVLKGNVVYLPPKIVFSARSELTFDEELAFSYNNWNWTRAADSVSSNPEVEMIAVGDLSGYQDESTVGLVPSISTFTIDTSTSLIATLNNKYSVRYNNWQIDYDSYTDYSSSNVPNMYILPLTCDYTSPKENPEYPDNREYSVSGSFIINGLEYGYGEGFTYKQTSEVVGTNADNTQIVESTITIEGALSIPGNPGYVIVSSSDIYPIIRDEDGIWKSGMLFISGRTDFVEIAFNDGSATIFYGSQEETVNSWQTALQPEL